MSNVIWLELSDASQVSIVVLAVILRALGKPCSSLSSRADGLYQCCQFWCNVYGPIRAKHCCFSLIALWRFKLHFKPLAIDALSPNFLPPGVILSHFGKLIDSKWNGKLFKVMKAAGLDLKNCYITSCLIKLSNDVVFSHVYQDLQLSSSCKQHLLLHCAEMVLSLFLLTLWVLFKLRSFK